MKNIIKTFNVIIAICIALLIGQGVALAAYDQPHTADNSADCGNCHYTSGAAQPSWMTPGAGDNTVNNQRCTQCHNAYMTHSTSSTASTFWQAEGGWMVECVNCHNPHYQMQSKRWGAESYQVTGTLAGVPTYNAGANESTVTINAPALSAEYQGYYLIPNTVYRGFVYKIKSITNGQTVLVVKGKVGTGATFPKAAAGTQFAIVYGKNVKDTVAYMNPGGTSVGSTTVKMFAPTGVRGPGYTVTPTDSVCLVCHTLASPPPSVPEHTASGDCKACHSHDEGFKVGGCDTCHGNPPGVNAGTVILTDKDGAAVTSASNGAGAHAKHNTAGLVCANCHTGGMTSASTGDDAINIGFNLSGNLGGTYSGEGGRTFPGNPFPYVAGGTTTVNTGGTYNCSNVYCHSTGQGSTANNPTPTYTTPSWYTAASGACGTCHATTAIATGSHTQHLGSGVNIGCGDCHTGAANDGSSYASANHVNKTIEVANSYTLGGAPGNGYGTCTVLTCHGNGTPAWGTAFTGGTDVCTKCHGTPTVGATASSGSKMAPPMATDQNGAADGTDAKVGAHQIHMDGTLNIYSAPVTCNQCHTVPGTVQAAGHIQDGTPGVAEVPLAGALATTNPNSVPGSPTYAAGQCSNTYCHDSSRFKNGWAGGTGHTPTWNNTAYLGNGKALDCGTCHGNPPLGLHPAATANVCNGCHSNVNAAGDGFVDKTLHANGTVEAVAGCTGCHDSNSNLAGKHNIHYNSTTDASGRLTTNTSTATNYVFQCGNCHNDATGHPGTVGANFADVVFSSGGNYTVGATVTTDSKGLKISTDGSCSNVYCHSNAAPAGGTNSYSTIAWNGTVSCGSCHKTTGTAASMQTAGTPQPMSAPHVQHMATDRYGANTNFTCNSCHSTTVSNNTTISDKSLHANAAKNVSMNATVGGAWSGTQCSNTYCHSNGTAAGGTHAAINWSGTMTCASCHGNAASITTNAHELHIGSLTTVGRTVGCLDCHAATAANDTTVSSYTNHVDKLVNVKFNNAGAINKDTDAPTYNAASTTGANGATKAPGSAAASCANVYCHSIGNLDATAAVVTAGGASFRSIAWNGAAIGCDGCHGDQAGKSHPVYTSGAAASTTANSHVKHVEGSSFSCDFCHNTTTTNATIPPTTVLAAGQHLDRTEDVSFKLNGGLTGTYNAGKTCSATYCHGTGPSVAWGGTTTCASCHDASNTGLSTRHDRHYNSATLPTAINSTNANTATAYVYGCGNCHPSATHSTGQADGTGPIFQDAQVATGVLPAKIQTYTQGGSSTTDAKGFNYTQGTCTSVCHTRDGAAAAPVVAAAWGGASTGSCAVCHRASGDNYGTMTGYANGLSATHNQHMATDRYGANSNFTCNSCHNTTASNNTTINGAAGRDQHPNAAKNVDFNGTVGGTWSGTQCSNTYCHSNGTASSGTHAAISWSGAVTCASCHGNSAATLTSGAHDKHVGLAGVTCAYCHNATATGSTTINSYTNHVNKSVTINFNASAAGATATYNGQTAGGATVYQKAVGTAAGSCNTTTCHGGNSGVWDVVNNDSTCVKCHGVAGTNAAAYTADIKTAAPGYNGTGVNTAGSNGAPLSGGVSADSKVGAHDTHLKGNGGYKTGGIACSDCHAVTALGDAGHMNGSTTMTWSDLAKNIGTTPYNADKGAIVPGYTAPNCSTNYCHGGGFAAGVVGNNTSPSWTSGTYLVNAAASKNGTDCNQCHQSPPTSSVKFAHTSMTISTDCSGCHNHNGSGDARHVNGTLEASGGGCNGCHDYDTTAGGTAWGKVGSGTGLTNTSAAWGGHAKHIEHLKTRTATTLDPATDTYGSVAFNNVCGTCHSQNVSADHGPNGGATTRNVNFNGSTTHRFGTSGPTYDGVTTKSCSSLDCHFKATPQWGL